MSKKDIWHPEQPSSHVVATRTFFLAAGPVLPPVPGIISSLSLLPLLSHHLQVWEELTSLGHFRNGLAFLGERPCWANVNALTAAGARFRRSPRSQPRSVMARDIIPRPITSHVWAPSISSQTRTHLWQRTQRLWSTENRSCVASMVCRGYRYS